MNALQGTDRSDTRECRGGLEVERPLRIQLKAGHYCLGGSNPAWGRMMEKF